MGEQEPQESASKQPVTPYERNNMLFSNIVYGGKIDKDEYKTRL
jgi:hypothetical protein